MSSASRAAIAASLLLVSASAARAGDHATFSPLLPDASATVAPAAGVPAGATAAVLPREGSVKHRARTARRGRAAVVADARRPKPAPSLAAASKAVVAAAPAEPAPAVPAPTPTAPQPAGNTEVAARTPSEAPVAGGAREVASGTVAELLAKHAMANGVPLKLAQAVVRIESRGNVHASHGGALGLMQIKYGTARAAGFGGPAVGLFAADTNLRFGMKVLGQAYKAAGGDLCGALMRYQSGHFATHMNAANRAYCSKARAIMAGA